MSLPAWVSNAAVWANVIAALAMLVALATFIFSRRDVRAARKAAQMADTRAERATKAAEEAAAAQRDLVDRFPAPSVQWEVRHLRDRLFEVRNTGQQTAYDVTLSFTSEFVTSRQPDPVPQPWKPGASIRLLAAGTSASGTPVLVLNWNDENGRPADPWTTSLGS